MTLIASTLNYKMPFLISDLVWSSEHSNVSTIFPTSINDPSPYLPTDQESKPVKLGQKMYIIKDKVCIVFAGLSDEILAFLTVFKDFFQSYPNISKDNIHDFLEGYKLDENYIESAFFITHVENLSNDSINVTQFYCPSEKNKVNPLKLNVKEESWNIMSDNIFETVSACGTGAEGFLNIVKQVGTLHTRFERGDFMLAVQTNMALISKILALERVAVYTLKKNWGGGFETAYYNGHRFEKMNEIAYVISHSKFNASGDIGLPIPMLIMYYKYVGDILYIVSIEVHKYSIQEIETFIIFTAFEGSFYTTIYEVEGIDVENIEDFEIPIDFSFTTNKIAMGYSLISPKNVIFNPAFFNIGPEMNITFQQNKMVEVKIDKRMTEEVRDKSKKSFENL
jgi:hypothetical protein